MSRKTLMFSLAVFQFFEILQSQSSPCHAQSSPGTIAKIPDQIRKNAAPAVVKISAEKTHNQGSGIVVGKTPKGVPVILTANHVIAGSEDDLKIQLENFPQPVPGKLIMEKWRNRELALIAVRSSLPASPSLPLGKSDLLTPGDEVSVLGFPQTPYLSQNSGRVLTSQTGRLALDFAIPAGQSGGPLLNVNGQIVGIAVAPSSEQNGAIPIDLARLMVEQWLGNVALAESWREEETTTGSWYGWAIGIGLLIATGVAIAASGVL